MKAILPLFYFLVGVTCSVLAQKSKTDTQVKIDSLNKVIQNTKSDTVKGRTLCRVCNGYRRIGKMEEALKNVNEGLKVLEAAGDLEGTGQCLNSLGNWHSSKGDYQQALIALEKALRLNESIDNKKGIVASLNNLGSIYVEKGDYVKGINIYQQSVLIADSIQDIKSIGIAYNNLGVIYTNLGDYPKSLEYNLKSLKCKEKLKDKQGTAISLSNAGTIYVNMKDFIKALDYFNKSNVIAQELGNQSMIATNYINIGEVLHQQKDYDKALDYIEKSLEIRGKIGDKKGIASTLHLIGEMYLDKRVFKSAGDYFQKSLLIAEAIGDKMQISRNNNSLGELFLTQKQALKAKQYAQKGIQTASEIKQLEFLLDGYKILYQADSTLGDMTSALKNYKLFKQYADSLNNTTQAQAIGRLESKYEYDKQTEVSKKQAQIEAERRGNFYYLFGGMFGIVLLSAGFLFYRYRSKAKHNQVLSSKNEMITSQKAELENAYEELNATLEQVSSQKTELHNAYEELNTTLELLREQKEEIEQKNLKIEDSIRYAYQIQTAILPNVEYLTSVLPRHFIFYQPKDIVSGDFYWVSQRDDKIFFCVADCTGHGVPGAFMSVVGSNTLHNAINEMGYSEPDVILSESDRSLRRTLRQESTSESKDGMDVALCILSDNVLLFAGAGRPLYHLRDGILTEIKGDKFPIGGGQHEHKTFTCHRMELKKGDRIYIFSDGITDQFGGTQKRKFTPKRLQEFIIDNAQLSLEAQGVVFQQTMHEWMVGHSQLDDLTLIGLEV